MIHRKRKDESGNPTKDNHTTIIDEFLQSDLPKEELSHERLKQEACSITGAAIETTKSALSLASFHITDNPDIYQRLHEELVQAMPDLSAKPLSVPELEKLPYLNAVVQESTQTLPLPHKSSLLPAITCTLPHQHSRASSFNHPPPFHKTPLLQREKATPHHI